MQHLKYLKYVHYAVGALYLLLSLCTCGGGVTLSVLNQEGSGARAGALVGSSLLVLIFALVFFNLGARLGRGQSRLGATLMALLQMGQCVGFPVALYVIWACWINKETKKVFDDPLSYDLD